MKTLIWIGMIGGGLLGGYVPMLWGAPLMSLQSVVGNTVGGVLGVWLGWVVGKRFEL